MVVLVVFVVALAVLLLEPFELFGIEKGSEILPGEDCAVLVLPTPVKPVNELKGLLDVPLGAAVLLDALLAAPALL